MKFSKNINVRNHCIILLSLSTLSSCIHEVDCPGPKIDPRQKEVVFQLTESDESNISTVDVFAFKVDAEDPAKEYFDYRVKGLNIADGSTEDMKKFSARLFRSGVDKYRFVVLADARSEIDALGEIAISTPKMELLDRIKSYNSGKWITDYADPNFKDIPMWGESEQLVIDDNTLNIDVNLTRSIVRLDVVLDAAASAKFKMTSVRIYNYNTTGFIAGNTDPQYWDGSKALLPYVPIDNVNTAGPLIYTEMSEPGVAFIREIYLYEVAGRPLSESTQATCLVIGGEYDNSGEDTFYRVDLVGNADKKNSIHLIRNRHYNALVSRIDGRGYDTPQEAFDAPPTNIEGEVVVWDKSEILEVVADGQNMLGVSRSYVKLPLNQRSASDSDNKFTITTDHPQGWRITKMTDENGDFVLWATVNRYVGFPNTLTTVSIIADENISEVDRVCYVHIQAGRLEHKIKVLQTTIPEINLSVTNSEGKEINELLFFAFTGSTVPAQELNIKWIPLDSDNFVSVIPVAGTSKFDFGSGDVISSGYILGASGYKQYNIQPPAMTPAEIAVNPFLEKTYRVDFTITNGFTNESKVLFLTQKNYAVVPQIENFLMDGNEKYFTLRANAPWQISIDSDPSGVITNLQTTRGGQYEDKREERVYFNVIDDMSTQAIRSAEVTFRVRFTNLGRPFPDKTFKLKFFSADILEPSNTYILKPSTILDKGYLIPVSRANQGVPGSIGENDVLETYLMWTDDASHVNTIKYEPIERGGTGYIYIYPGTPQGNSVVAVRVGGVVKWSWHIWHLNSDPATVSLGAYTLLDRNLGALNNGKGNIYSTGTYYQWGRKDPFPQSNGITSTANIPIYNKAGLIGSIPTSASGSTLDYTIQNPLTFLINGSTWNGSLGGATSWSNGGNKTVFDPCPAGWKVPPPEVWALMSSGTTWDGTSRGRTHTTAGWFSASGTRLRGSGALSAVGATGGYWSSGLGNPYSPTLNFTSTLVTVNMNYYVIDGAVVRCVRE